MTAFTRPNRRINIRRRSTPSGVHGTRTLPITTPDKKVFLRFSDDSFIDDEGEVLTTDGEIRVEPGVDLKRLDVVELISDPGVYYRVLSLKEITNAGGRVVAKKGVLARAADLES